MTISVREKTLFALLCVALPIVIMGAWIGCLSYDRATAEPYHVIVKGYDPRDLLHGKFLNVRYAWEDARSQKPNRDMNDLPISAKYYVPEWDAQDLETMLREDKNTFSADITLNRRNKTQIKALYIDDKPWEEALATWRENRDNSAHE
ncbi:MAG TPA: hypothetical protein VIN59_04205 [Alphaproteobacteria bacterium]